MPICNRNFSFREFGKLDCFILGYKCFQCSIHPDAIFCRSCFQNGNHQGHRFKKFQVAGNCDCGSQGTIKKQGFCINHSGKNQDLQIQEQSRNEFEQIIGWMFEWFFIARQTQAKCYQYYAQLLVNYLLKLNAQSSYYNILTAQVLTKQKQDKKCLLDKIFELKQNNLIDQFSNLYYEMFSQKKFKIILANKLLDAFNTIIGVQNTKFNNIFTQLFIDPQILITVCDEYKNTFYIQKKQYNSNVYLSNLFLITKTSIQASVKFYQLFFFKNLFIPFQQLQQIQFKFQNKQQMHVVDLVTDYQEKQLFYLYVVNALINTMKQNQQILILFCNGLFCQLFNGQNQIKQNQKKKKFSYIKNRAVIPLHRSFAFCLFTLFHGNIQAITVQILSNKLSHSQEQIMNFYYQNVKIILNCLMDFAETFVGQSYFHNYLSVYVKYNFPFVHYDYLFLKETAYLLANSPKQLDFDRVLRQQYISIEKKKNSETTSKYIRKIIIFCHILIECCVSYLPQINAYNALGLNNNKSDRIKNQIYKGFICQFDVINQKKIQMINRFIIQDDNRYLFSKYLQFNKNEKKYNIKVTDAQQTRKMFNSNIYISKKKTPQTIISDKQIRIGQINEDNNENNNSTIILNIILPKNTIQFLFQTIQNQKFQLIDNKNTAVSIIQDFTHILGKLSMYNNNIELDYYLQLQNKLKKILQPQQQYIIKTQNSIKQYRLKKIDIKKKKLIERQKKILQKYQNQLNQCQLCQLLKLQSCIICKDNKQQQTVNLCYYATVKFVKLINIFQKKDQINQFTVVYHSCFHTAHYYCIQSKRNGQEFQCPLCKAICSFLLPVDNQYLKSTFKQFKFSIKQVMLNNLNRLREEYPKLDQKKLIINSLIFELIQLIGVYGICFQKQFMRKYVQLCSQLIRILIFIAQQNNDVINYLLNLHKNELKIQIQNIKQCIIQSIVTIIKGQQFNKNEIIRKHKSKINSNNLNKLTDNLSEVFYTISQKHIKNESISQTICSQQYQSQSLQLIEALHIYKPPLTIKQLLKQRDNIKQKDCKIGHNVCKCIDCNQIVCIQCKSCQRHNYRHGMESMYFSFQYGGMILYDSKQVKIKYLYENCFGDVWTFDKDPDKQTYELNQDEYKQIIGVLLSHQITQYMKNIKGTLDILSDIKSDIVIA